MQLSQRDCGGAAWDLENVAAWHPEIYDFDNVLQGYMLEERVGRWLAIAFNLCFSWVFFPFISSFVVVVYIRSLQFLSHYYVTFLALTVLLFGYL